MAANDWVGQKVLDASRRVGASVPEEVAVVGVDNDEAICEISDPMLSSVVARHDRVGFYAAELLDRLMQGKPAPAAPMIVGAPSVVVRRSTDVQTIADRDVVAAVQFIRENACRGLRVDDVAAHVALSYSTLKRRFQRTLARSVHDEIMRVRMQRVRELLAETTMTLAQLSRAAGFPYQEYLRAIFKS
jgi:LacI family transcriptional regulator